jgi:predicted LPLAT superfamily acyltransferase
MNAGPASPERAAWTTQAERSNAWVLRIMRWIAVALGRRIARLVLHPITVYFLLFGGAAGRASRAYLQRVLGRPPRWSERYRHVHCFAATILDRVYLLRGDFHQFEVQVTGLEHLELVLQAGRGAFLVGAHLGSFEALRSLGQSRRGLRIAMLMYEQNARMMNATLRAVAPDVELHVIGLGRMEAMLELRDWLDGGGVAGLLADRTLQGPQQAGSSGRSHTHWIDFLGRPAAFSDGPFRLALLLKRPVVAMAGLYHGDNRYELRFAPVVDFSAAPEDRDEALAQAVQRYVGWLQAQCRETPFNWFNFFDFWAGAAGAATTQDHATTVPPSPVHGAPGAADAGAGPARTDASRRL